MKSPFSETQEHQIRRMCHDLMRSPQGKDFGRLLMREINREDGNYVGVKNRLLDILSEVISDLYQSKKPVQSR